MITTSSPPLSITVIHRVVGAALIAVASTFAVASAMYLGDIAIILALFWILAAMTLWRPRYGVYAALILLVAFENLTYDPVMYYGSIIQSNISTWSPIGFINVTLIEALILIAMIRVGLTAVIERKPLRSMKLLGPLALFLTLVVGSFIFGVFVRRGDLNIALWEVRSFFFGGAVAVLIPNTFTRRAHVHRLMNLITIAVVLLSAEIVWRRIALGDEIERMGQESAFSHETPVLLNFVIIFLIARLVWPASGGQRLVALAIPLILYAQMLTERRAGWICLDVSLILVAIFMFRLRRKGFYLIVLPLAFVYMGYLAAFWSASGPLAQPARAVRSINDPEGRDVASNIARQLEMANLRMNIHMNPVTGVGFGRQYIDFVGEFNLSFWPFWHYMAHNTVVWIWVEMGTFGFMAFLMLIGAGIVRGIHILKASSRDRSAPILVALVSGILMSIIISYVDFGLTNERISGLLGLALGVIGGWPRLLVDAEECS